MNAYLIDNSTSATSFASTPVLIAGDSPAALRRAVSTVEEAGLRVGCTVELAEAAERMRMQAAAALVWLELEEDGGDALDAVIDQLGVDVADGRYRGVIAAPSALVDLLTARTGEGDVDLVIDGSEADRVSALALACSGFGRTRRLSDVAADRSADRLRQLSDEVGRIAATLARLSTGPDTASRSTELPPSADAPEVSAEVVRSVIRARRLRTRYFPDDMFADPAWDMLLDLLQAEIAQLRVPVSSLCIAAAVPATTALRWLKTMTQQGIFLRRADPHDGRRVFVELAPDASKALRRYFADVGKPVVV